jgi:hypothetical protein
LLAAPPCLLLLLLLLLQLQLPSAPWRPAG